MLSAEFIHRVLSAKKKWYIFKGDNYFVSWKGSAVKGKSLLPFRFFLYIIIIIIIIFRKKTKNKKKPYCFRKEVNMKTNNSALLNKLIIFSK